MSGISGFDSACRDFGFGGLVWHVDQAQNAFLNSRSFHVITYESLPETIGKWKAKSKGNVSTVCDTSQ